MQRQGPDIEATSSRARRCTPEQELKLFNTGMQGKCSQGAANALGADDESPYSPPRVNAASCRKASGAGLPDR